MSTTEVSSDASATSGVGRVDMKLEVVVIPVSDVDRAKEFYSTLGWRLDGEFVGEDGGRSLQYTPPGSGCSIQFGTSVTTAAPGSAQAMHLVVNDIHAAREHLRANGIEATGVYHCDTGYACRYPGGDGRVDGRHPDGGTYGSFVSFEDPDGNGWVLQEVTARFPGRVEGETTYASAEDLSRALRRAAAAQGQDGASDPEWLDRLAGYMVREQAGRALPS